MRKPISSQNGAKPIGPYSPAMHVSGNFLFVSGQGPINPDTGKTVLGSFQEQAELTFKNVESLLKAGGASFANVIKVNVYLSDLKDFDELNRIYARHFAKPYPTRTTVGTALIGGIAIEVDCIAVLED